jgi:transposase
LTVHHFGDGSDQRFEEIDAILKALVAETAPALNAVVGVGTDVASALLVAAGDNPEHLKSEATFAHLCGASPIDASSGKKRAASIQQRG